jgi:hypothetical protein
MLTTDKVLDNAYMKAIMNGSDHPGSKLGRPVKTKDGKFIDTSGAFLQGELDRRDQTEHAPLFSVSYDRDVPIRTDVTLGDEVSSFTQSNFGTPGGAGTGSAPGQKRSVISKIATQLPEMQVDLGVVTVPLIPWGEGLAYSLPELESAAQLGRPIDQQKIRALDDEYQLQMDAQAYLGWNGNNTFGLINSPLVTATNLPNGVSGFPYWQPRAGVGGKTAGEILTDMATMVYAPWAASGFAVKPNRLMLDPQNYNYIRITPATTAGSKSILQYFLESYNADSKDEPLRILPLKWLTGAGSGGTLLQPATVNRAVAYHRFEGSWENAPVRFPLTMLSRTPIQFDGLWHKFYKWGRMGACEFVYPETLAYFDGN